MVQGEEMEEVGRLELMAQLYIEAIEALIISYTHWIQTPVASEHEEIECLEGICASAGGILKRHVEAQAEGRI